MNLLNVVGKASPVITRFAGRAGLVLSKHAPDILVGTGVVGFVGTVVLGARETLSYRETVEEDLELLVKITDAAQPDSGRDDYTREMYIKDKTILYSRLATKTVKHYAPAIGMGVATLACFLGAHGMMRHRLAASMAAYEVLDTAYSEYRSRVRDILGDEQTDVLERTMVEQWMDEEDGPDGHKIADALPDVNGVPFSQYARVFDTSNIHWTDYKAQNEMFLAAQQRYANELLRIRGHVFLNEVYDMLGIPRTEAGQMVGWLYRGEGDGYINFHADENAFDRVSKLKESAKGTEAILRFYVLDFNVDGMIHNKI